MIYLIWVLISLLFAFSLIGVVIPFLPDTILLWVGFLIYQFIVSTTNLPFTFWSGMIILTILIISSDFMANAYFVKKHGGSKLAMAGAVAGLILGTIFLGPLGIIIGPFILVFIIAILEKKNSNDAFKIGIATLLAFFSSSIAKILLQLLMILWFFIVVL